LSVGLGDAYRERKAAREAEAQALRERERRLSQLRLLLFALGVGLAFAAFGVKAVPAASLIPVVVLFLVLLPIHERVIRRREADERAVAFYERGLARLEHRFAGTGTAGDEYLDPHHPYAGDLDLFGRGSLFELLCTARTRAGEETLAGWLLEPAEPPELRARQGAVSELTPGLDLREQMALLGEDLRIRLHPETLEAWANAPPVGLGNGHRFAAGALAAVAVGALALWILTPAGPVPFLAALLAEAAFAFMVRRRVQAVLRSVDTPSRELGTLAELLACIEAQSFTSPHLVALRARLDSAGLPPSRQIARLRRLVEHLDARRNQLFAPIAALLLWGVQFTAAIEAWRNQVESVVADWLRATGEIEALLSLASHAAERPGHTFPELVEGGPIFEGEALGHPLLAPDVCIPNDLLLDGERQALVVSGSNMSGKSTFLRTVGINAVLAQAGSVVCARRLRCSPFSVGASIRITDSLQEGASHFYAEITRIRQVMGLAEGERPALFLLDEIFHGTNSHDRGIGADAVLRALLERGAIGLVTTHDLALAEVADRLAPRTANVHFADHLEGDRIAFDYRKREGVVQHSNALALMRAVGLPV
jgi:hypothetical protein